MKKNISKLLAIIAIIIGMMIVKSNLAYADTSAYYLGSKDATKATGYNQAKDSNGNNIEATLDLSQKLDKMIYYILTYEEYENKTYVGDSSLLDLEARKQATIYYLIHNYKQDANNHSKLTSNEKLKEIFENYSGSGNNLSEFDSNLRNGVQVIYGLSEAWAKGEDVITAAQKLKINYVALSSDNLKYWAKELNEPLEGSIYNPNTKDNTLIVTVYLPKEEKTAQNAIKVVDKEIVEEKKTLINNILDNQKVNIAKVSLSASSWIEDAEVDDNRDEAVTKNVGETYKYEIKINGTIEYSDGYHNYIPKGFYCLDHNAYVGDNYGKPTYTELTDETDIENYTKIFVNWYSNNGGTVEEKFEWEKVSEAGNNVWTYLEWSWEKETVTCTGSPNDTVLNKDYKVVGYYVYMPKKSDITYHGQSYYRTGVPYNGDYVFYANQSSIQPLIKPKWEKISEKYNIMIGKYDAKTKDFITSSAATFNVNGTDYNTSKGIATVSNLEPSGTSATIKVKETAAPSGYQIDNKNEISITATFDTDNQSKISQLKCGTTKISDSSYTDIATGYKAKLDKTNNTIKIKVTDSPYITPKLQIKKVDSEDGSALEGFKFKFNSVNTEYTTNSNGICNYGSLGNLVYGKSASIKIQETGAKEGYKIDNGEQVTLTYSYKSSGLTASLSPEYSEYSCIVSGNTIIVTVKDSKIKYNLKIKKVNKNNTSQVIPGVKFDVSDGNTIKDTDKETDKDGLISYKNKTINKNSFTINIQEKSGPSNLSLDNTGEISIPITVNQTTGTISTTYSGTTDGVYSVSITGNTVNVVVKDTPNITPKIKILKVDSSNTSTILGGATFKVNKSDGTAIATKTTASLGSNKGWTDSIKLDNIKYGSKNGITIDIQETIAPKGYRVDNKDPVRLNITYENGSNATFANNSINVSFDGDHTGYTIKNIKPEGYIEGDTIEIQVTDSKISDLINLEIEKQDYDTNNPVQGAKFNVYYKDTSEPSRGRINQEVVTKTNGIASISSLGIGTNNANGAMLDNRMIDDNSSYYRAFANGSAVDLSDANILNWIKGVKQSSILYKEVGNTDHTAFYEKDGLIIAEKDTYYMRVVEKDASSGYKALEADVKLRFFTDEQGLVYAAVAGSEWGRRWVTEVSFTETTVSNQIVSTIKIQIKESPMYTIKLNKFEKDITSGSDTNCTSTTLAGAEFETIRLKEKDKTTKLLETITTNRVEIEMNKLQSFNYKTGYLKNISENEKGWLDNDIPDNHNIDEKEMTETKITYSGNTATFKCWHEDYAYEGSTILYQIKEVKPPEGYQPRNFYLLINTKDGNLNAYIGYQEDNKIVFNRTSTENIVDIENGVNVTNNQIELNVANPAIRCDLSLHKVDIYTNNGIENTTFNLKNVKTVTSAITDSTGYIRLEHLRTLDINDTSNKKIIEIVEKQVPTDYKLPDSPSDTIKVQIKFKYNGTEYNHYKDIPWGSADGTWCQDDANYKLVTVVAHFLTSSGDPYFTYELNSADYATAGNQKVELTIKNTPIISLNLNKMAGNGQMLNSTKFTISEYTKADITRINSISDIPTANYGNIKLFTSGNRTYTDTTNELEVTSTGTTNIRFLADKALTIIKIEENSTDEHYSIIYEPIYLVVKDGHIATLYKGNKRDRIRLSNEKGDTMGTAEYGSFTRETTTFDVWDNSSVRHGLAIDIHNLTQMWLDFTKIFTGFESGTIEGTATFKITTDKLKTINDTVTITSGEVGEQVENKYFKYEFLDNFERDSNGDDTDKTLTVTFTVKEESSIYNKDKQQFWAEIPEFTFTATYKKDNNGNIWLEEITQPVAKDKKFKKTIEDLYNLKYKGTDRYIDITIKGDKNATINFKLRNPQVKNFDFYLTKYDQDMHAGTSHPDVAAMNEITFNIEAVTAKTSYMYNNVQTSTMNINGKTCNGILKVTLDINDVNFRKNIDGNQSNNCLIDSTENINFLITEVETYNNVYYKFRKKPITVTAQITIDEDGYYRLDENFTSNGSIDTSNIKSTKITLATEDSSNDITGLRNPSICKLTPGKNLIAIDVPNKRRWIKLQGNVWKDTASSGKVSEVNGIKDGGEQGIQGITVRLHKTTTNDKVFNRYAWKIQEYADNKISNIITNISGQNQIDSIVKSDEITYLETVTDENGNYYFPIAMYNGQYYVEFIYNGYKYEHTVYSPWNGNGIYSNATETENQRDNLNNKFETITPNMQVDSGIVTNLINSETSETTTNYNGINIGISAWTGGYGYDDYVRYSATRSPDARERIVYNSKENTEIPNDASSRNVLDSAHKSVKYDYVYNNVNFGITPRETVRLKLTKGVSNVTLNSGKNDGAKQSYAGESYEIYNESTNEIHTENNIRLAPNVPNIETKTGDEFKNATADSIENYYNKYKNAIGNYDLGVRVEDEYAYLDSDQITAVITYAIKLTNNSSEIGVQVNELVDYFDESFKYEDSKITVIRSDGKSVGFSLTNENKALQIYNSSSSNTGSSRNMHEMHIVLNEPIQLDPFATEIVYVTFEMDVKDNVVINDTDGVQLNNDSDVNINNITNIDRYRDKIKTNVAEVWSYRTYYVTDGLNNGRTNTYNEHSRGDSAGLVDLNSNPGNVTGLKETGIAVQPYIPYPNEYDSGIAFVKLVELRRRTISGNVWKEDRNTNVENAMIGNGEKDDDESGLKDVKVQLREYLHNADGSITDSIARVYVDNNVYTRRNASTNEIANTDILNPTTDTNKDDVWIEAPTIITTNGNYTYTFTGVTTGDYYILFTYPDGQTYKTTVYNGQTGFDSNNPDDNKNVICDLNNSNKYSDARDIYSQDQYSMFTNKTRIYVDSLLGTSGEINGNAEESYYNYISNNYGNNIAMNAITGHINIGFEATGDITGNIKKVPGSIEWEYVRTFKKENIDLGLVERPVSQLKITKDIENVRLELSNGNILFDASERASNVMWISADDNNDWYYTTYNEGRNTNELFTKNPNYKIDPAPGETYNRYLNRTRASVLVTLDEELMQGATVKIKYKITVTNVGEVDYSDKKFYYSGLEDNPASNIVKTIPLQIVDYVGYKNTSDEHATRNNLNFVENLNSGYAWEYKTANDLKEEKLLSDTLEEKANIYNTIVVHNTNLELNATNGLVPVKRVDACTSIPTEYSTEIVLSKMISSNSSTDELSYDNLVEILHLKNEVGRRTRYSTVGNQNSQEDPAELDSDNSGSVVFSKPFGEKVDEINAETTIRRAGANEYTKTVNYRKDIYLAIAILVLTGLAIKINQKIQPKK